MVLEGPRPPPNGPSHLKLTGNGGGPRPPPFLWELQWNGVARQGPPSPIHAECGYMAQVRVQGGLRQRVRYTPQVAHPLGATQRHILLLTDLGPPWLSLDPL